MEASVELFASRMNFNSRPSARGDRCGCAPAGRPADFNSRPSARGDRGRPVVDAKYLLISIHAPPRGATLQAALRMRYSGKFQFTPLREGRRGAFRASGCHTGQISIHAPPRGATKRRLACEPPRYFNSRPSARGDARGRGAARVAGDDFNSRPSARGDPRRNAPKSFRPPFQFTPLREGRLLGTMAMARGCLISIHAPPRGATAPNSKKS